VGGQTENQGGQTGKKFSALRAEFSPQMFAHPGLKPCRRPWPVLELRVYFSNAMAHGSWLSPMEKVVKIKCNFIYIFACWIDYPVSWMQLALYDEVERDILLPGLSIDFIIILSLKLFKPFWASRTNDAYWEKN
jgi:hypothetical protein